MPPFQVYIETSVPSFYHTTRRGAAAVARREWTRQWWSLAQERYTLVSSDPVLDELRRGDHLANANKYGHIRRVNNLLGLYVPVLATPLELLGDHHE